MVVVGGLLALLWLLVDGSAPQAPAQLELVRIGTTVLLGAGGLFGLYIAWRRQRSAEIALQQKQQDQADVARAYELQRETFEINRLHQERVAAATEAHQERVAKATETDSTARQITELYTKAVEQLGSDKAPVRLGGLYALERLAQDHAKQRQTIVNVLCAYLRMPYTLPGTPPTDDADTALLTTHQHRTQEREVRLTAQRILTHHLHIDDTATFWHNIDLDLTGALLIDLDLADCTIRTARFDNATFTGTARFNRTTFTSDASFTEATFTTNARFHRTAFSGTARFTEATFTGTAGFTEATFTGGTWFNRTTFSDTSFAEATFISDAWFHQATFAGEARFTRATFTSDAGFNQATFTSAAVFDKATFTSDAWFYEATFAGDASFTWATFTDTARITKVTFSGDAWFDGVSFDGAADFGETVFGGAASFQGATLPTRRHAGPGTPAPWVDFSRARFEAGGAPPEVRPFLPKPDEADPSPGYGEPEGDPLRTR
ncbi:hypothetical protein Aglo01_01870 [Actinokineospora globicatena]|nr:hypothetical protein Aglo01_01870 [Actinokineospora globicatena]GLW82546.1 hypothetical protein Aglo02_01870 [Actinokineospora globicatena]